MDFSMSAKESEKRLVDLHVDGKIISVRRDVLVENSAYFEAIFQPQHPGFIEKNSDSLILQDFDSVLLAILVGQLKYPCEETGSNDELVSKMTPPLFYLCVRLMMKFDYEKVAIESLTIKNCHDYIVAAENTASSRLLRAARHKILVTFTEFRRTLAFRRLTKDELISYLSNRHLVFKFHKQILEAIIWWLRFDLQKRELMYKDLASLVNWSKLNSEQYKHLKKLKTVKKCYEFLKFINLLESIKLNPRQCLDDSNKIEAKALIDQPPRQLHPLILLVESVLIQKTENKSLQCFAFYDVESQIFLKDYVIVEDFPVGCAIACHEGHLLIFGGIFGITTSRWNYDIKAYNIFTKTWKIIGRLPKPRRHFELVQNGNQFYLLGGTSTFRLPTATMDVFDFRKGTVKSCSDMVFKMNYPFACCWSGNYLYIFDGSNSACPIYSYDPNQNDWKVHLPAFKVIYGKLDIALACGKYVYLTGFNCPVLLRKYVKRLREERIDTSKTWINDCELISSDIGILSFFEYNAHIYLFYETEKKNEFALESFNTKTAIKSKIELPKFYQELQELVKSFSTQNISLQKIVKTKSINAAWMD